MPIYNNRHLIAFTQQNASEIEQNNMLPPKFEKARNLVRMLFCMSTPINSRCNVVTRFMTRCVEPKCLVASLRFPFFRQYSVLSESRRARPSLFNIGRQSLRILL